MIFQLMEEKPVPKPRTKEQMAGGRAKRVMPEAMVFSHNWSSFHGRSHRRRSSEPSIKKEHLHGIRKSQLHTLPSCPEHPSYRYDQYCQQCEVPACPGCVTSGLHRGHDVQNISNVFDLMREIVQKDTQELDMFISPFYDTVMSDIETTHKIVVAKHQERKKMIVEVGKNLHKIVDNITQRYLKDENEMEADDLKQIQSLEMRFLRLRNQVRMTVDENHQILTNNDFTKFIGQLLNYTSKNQHFRDVPERFEMVVADFNPSIPEEGELCEIIGSLGITKTKSIDRYRLPILRKITDKSHKTASSSHSYHLLGKIRTGFTRTARVSCSQDGDQLYVCGDSKVIKHFSKEKFELIEEVQTLTGNEPFDITVTKDGVLVYTDWEDGSINIVKGGKVEGLVKLTEWKPQAICCTYTNELLVAIKMADHTQSKIVRYHDCKVTQEIQYNDSRTPLYANPAFVEENKNCDIIVSDWTNQVVVVVTRLGKFRFSYTGNLQTSKNKKFNPFGLATDSQSHILISDCDNFVVHLIDKNGQFLHYIEGCHLQYPWGLCIDKSNVLFVAECYSNDVKRIQSQK